jgi:TPR repeat protein
MQRRLPHYLQEIPFRLGDGAAAGEASPDPIDELRALAERGSAGAAHLLGLAYVRGQLVARDLGEARRLQKQAAENGIVDAQFELSLLLAQGLGGPVDTRGARRWEERAAKAGHPRACLNRGARLARARRPDYAAVAQWYTRAADGGSAEAAARLCKMHLVGQGVARDQATARGWYARAAALGYEWARDGAAATE